MALNALIDQLKTIPDWRQGGRTVACPLWLMILMSLLGVMSGISSIRGLADFMERHQQEVVEYFELPNVKLPRNSNLRRMLHRVDPADVAQAFHQWADDLCSIETGQAFAFDGKSLGSTVSAPTSAKQDFISVVSACVHQYGWVVAQISFHNGEKSEIGVVQELLTRLDGKGVWVTLDALHTQKKRSRSSLQAKMTTALD
ncbi:MAG: ISAs1 family transposase [Okeania sp. SIO4D6]|nr:ISAs1 family transposase [Okeania sp. SIO2G5]NEP08504.1 ISAs1 family transposase [Okeania sp. SIO4D6]NEP76177.1 ISAs1 family transposase [Okeania sp. SIO2G5]